MSKTFTGDLKKYYDEACESNKENSDGYYCATSTGVSKRILDLKSDYVFCIETDKKGAEEPKKNVIMEYRLQAYLVEKAKSNAAWFLPFEKKNWRLLDAERNFAGEDLSIEGKGRRLDLLAYEADTKTFIVLELKVTRALSKAKRELKRYTSTIQNNIKQMNDYYSVEAQHVQGYIVWHSCPRPRLNEHDWGILEYDKNFLDKEKIENIKFEIIKEPD